MSKVRVDVVSHVPEVMRKLTSKLRRGMERAGAYVEGQVKWSLSVPGPTKSNPDAEPSDPGDPPHARTGNLRAQQAFDVIDEGGKLILALGVKQGPATPYAARLEYGDEQSGPGTIAARPYVRPQIINNRAKIMKIIAGSGQ